MMKKYKVKPEIVEAMQFTGSFSNYDEICCWANVDFPANSCPDGVTDLFIDDTPPLERIHLHVNDWVIKGNYGFLTGCRSDTFKDTYELIEE